MVLGQASVANLVITEDSFDIPERMLDLRSHRRLDFLDPGLIAVRTHGLASSGTFGDMPADIPILVFCSFLDTTIAGITKHSLLLAVKQLRGSLEIVSVVGLDAAVDFKADVTAGVIEAFQSFATVLKFLRFAIDFEKGSSR